jgi:hypothetical protein
VKAATLSSTAVLIHFAPTGRSIISCLVCASKSGRRKQLGLAATLNEEIKNIHANQTSNDSKVLKLKQHSFTVIRPRPEYAILT